jgi:hypothetical protein
LYLFEVGNYGRTNKYDGSTAKEFTLSRESAVCYDKWTRWSFETRNVNEFEASRW